MNYDKEMKDAVRVAIAQKLMIRTKRMIRKITCDSPCQCRDNLIATMTVLISLGRDVFELRPEYYMSLVILSAAIREMVDEMKKTETDKVIYL